MKVQAAAITSIDDHIAGFPPEVRRILQQVRRTIRQAAPEAQEVIKYGIPTFVLNGNLVHFAGCARHVGFYPTPSAIAAFRSELQDFVHAKGSVQFPLDRPLPYDLIRRMVEFRVAEVLKNQPTKRRGGSPGAAA